MKQNKEDCIQLMEQTHAMLEAIVTVHLDSKTNGELPPNVLNHIGKFMQHVNHRTTFSLLTQIFRTLHKIHTFVMAQQSSGKLKKFLRQNEMSTLLRDCKAELRQALDSFSVSLLFERAACY